MKRFLKYWVGICLFFLALNYFSIFRDLVIGWLPVENNNRFYYTDVHKEFVQEEVIGFMPKGAKKYEKVIKWHQKWLECHPSLAPKYKTLYRRFEMKPWQFWNWFNYFTHPRWDLPYLDESQKESSPRIPTPSICPESK